MSISDLINSWPLLFTEYGLLNHFRHLVGINLKDKLEESRNIKGKKILNFFKDEDNQKTKIKELFSKFSEFSIKLFFFFWDLTSFTHI